jgi:hypothetical protein
MLLPVNFDARSLEVDRLPVHRNLGAEISLQVTVRARRLRQRCAIGNRSCLERSVVSERDGIARF